MIYGPKKIFIVLISSNLKNTKIIPFPAICGNSFRLTTELVAHVRSNHRHSSRYDRQQRTYIGEAQLKEKLTNVQRREEWMGNEAEIQNNLQNEDN